MDLVDVLISERCAGCLRIFYVCEAEYRGGIYCDEVCSHRAVLAAKARHQASPEGRLDHRDASSAFPFLFTPRGTLLDGGAVDNTPIKHALGDARDVDRIFVITPHPRMAAGADARELRGARLALHLVDLGVRERLYRDLREAEAVNRALRALEDAAAERRERVLTALGWGARRIVEIVEVRPTHALPGNAFAGLFDRGLRREYVARGREAAARALRERSAS